jgi:hypothetical protein
MSKDSSRNTEPEYLYGTGQDGKVTQYPITRRTPKRVYFMLGAAEEYISREPLERDGKVSVTLPGWIEKLGSVLYSSAPGAPAVAVTRTPAASTDSSRNNDGNELDRLWQKLSRADWSSSSAAYATACDARQIITETGMTLGAFASECKIRRISGFGSQPSVSRRLRWAELHDQLWDAGILPRDVFISEAASRPLFDGKLTDADRLKLLADLFAAYLSDDQKQHLAEELSEALMREHLACAGHEATYKAPRTLIPEKVITALLAQGMTADAISTVAHQIEDSARNATAA